MTMNLRMAKQVDGVPIVELTDEDIDKVRRLALIRTESHHEDEIDWATASPTTVTEKANEYDDKKDIDIVGVKGEYAFSKFYGLSDPYSERDRIADEGHDFIVRFEPTGDTLSVDVKCSNNQNTNLLKPHFKTVTADMYVLTKVLEDGRRVILPGFTTGEILRNAPLTKKGMNVPARKVSKHSLIDMPKPTEITGATHER